MKKFNKICSILATLMVVFFIQENVYADMNGVDISNNDETINWGQLRTYTNNAIIKATEGVDFLDSKLEENYQGAVANNFNVGFYHFMSERTDPAAQAVEFWNSIKNKRFNIIPALDIETNNWERSGMEVTNRALTFLNKFKEVSRMDCMIYSGGYFSRDILDFRVKNLPLWEAHYNGQDNMNCMDTGFGNVVGHQYSETGRVPGISTNCDLNCFTDDIFLSNVNKAMSYLIPKVQNTNCIGKVAQLQQLLNNQCGYSLDMDNIYGICTDTALRNSNSIAGLAYHTPELTKWIQLRLGIGVDGIYGGKTEAEVKNWQASHGLSVDGLAGYNTIKSLALA